MSDFMAGLVGLPAGRQGQAHALALVERLRRGVEATRVQRTFESLQLSMDEGARSVGINLRTLQRRKAAHGRLDPVASEKVARLARVADTAGRVLGAREAAAEWMKSPNRALGDATPLSLLDTDVGAEAVMDVLVRIESGVFS
jgi:putative toxin-antitoxin system antitoxin component (TIGR02293 family)